MKKLAHTFIAFVAAFFLFSGTTLQAQTFVAEWGFIHGNNDRTGGWDFVPGDPGSAGVAGNQNLNGNWSAIRGGFDTITATELEAIVVSGKIAFTGAGPSTWSGLRYGLFRHDNPGVVEFAGTDSADWSGEEGQAYGYMFTPHSGVNDQVSWASGGNGTQGVIRGATWLSSFGNAHRSLGVINQRPPRAEFSAGVYNWAISVQPQADGSNEVRFYMVKDEFPVTYWYGGIVKDTSAITTTFNGVCFALNGGNGAENSPIRSMSLSNVQVGLGAPIEIPEAPFVPFYVADWGYLGNRYGSAGWSFVPGEFDGNAGIAGPGPIASGWAAIRGGFPQSESASLDKALIVTGKMEFIGGGFDGWSGLRFGLFYHDSAGVLVPDATPDNGDSTRWNGVENRARGYMFTPHSGVNDQVAWANGGNGTQGVTRNGNWISSFGNNLSLGVINQRPARAVASAGVYNFAISVQPKANGTKELRFYVVKEDNSYWYGGIVTDTTFIAPTFNGVCFAIENTNPTTTGMNLIDVHVDKGEPIEIPEAPFVPFYVADWGYLGNRYGSAGWSFVPGEFDGNAGIAGPGPIASGWAAIRGGFPQSESASLDKALIVTGKMEFIGGGFDGWSGLRFGLFYHDSAGVLVPDATPDNGDSTRWNGVENRARGYMFTPHSGVNDQVAWANGGNGTQGVTRNGNWISSFGNNLSLGVINQRPARAVASAGVYNFAISVQPKANGTKELRFYVVKEDNSYWYGGIVTDTTFIAPTFNGVCFAIENTNPTTTGMNLIDVHVDKGEPIEIPEAPFVAFYAEDWGFIGNRIGGWSFTPGDVTGNASISGSAPSTGWAALRAGFLESVAPTTSKALLVTGQMEFVGGGFQAANSLRFGLFYSDSAGTVIKDATPDNGDSTRWSGTERAHSGYLFLPQSGTNGLVNWAGSGQQGSWGGVVNDVWLSTDGASSYVLGTQLHQPANAVAGAGLYDFSIKVSPLGNGTSEVQFSLTKTDGSYSFAATAIDSHNPLTTTKFNSVAFAINTNASTTGLNLIDVKVDMVENTVSVDEAPGVVEIPTDFVLSQNYPNPFNPSTTIEFGLPQSSEVKLVVFDLAGRVVARPVAGQFSAGYHKITFNATNLSSGIYYYRLEAKDFVGVKKLLFLK